MEKLLWFIISFIINSHLLPKLPIYTKLPRKRKLLHIFSCFYRGKKEIVTRSELQYDWHDTETVNWKKKLETTCHKVREKCSSQGSSHSPGENAGEQRWKHSLCNIKILSLHFFALYFSFKSFRIMRGIEIHVILMTQLSCRYQRLNLKSWNRNKFFKGCLIICNFYFYL